MKKPNIPTATAEEKTLAIRAIAKMMGDINATIITNGIKNDPREKLIELGYEPVESSSFYTNRYKKNGLIFCVEHYNSNYTYGMGWGFYYGVEKYCHLNQINEHIDEVIARGFKSDYTRSAETTALLEFIKEKVAETKRLVDNNRSGLLGGILRSRGYFVSYDGYSVCNFSKDGIIYSAHCDRGWTLNDSYEVYLANGKMSSGFSLYGGKRTDGNNLFEVIVGNITKLGRRETEKDLLPTYKKFKVRTYESKYLETIATFDNFEEAKKFAYDTAVEKAKSITDYCRQWAITNPKDRGEDYDMLACFVWYSYNGSTRHLVFVQGE